MLGRLSETWRTHLAHQSLAERGSILGPDERFVEDGDEHRHDNARLKSFAEADEEDCRECQYSVLSSAVDRGICVLPGTENRSCILGWCGLREPRDGAWRSLECRSAQKGA